MVNVIKDPERNEINALFEFAGELAGKRVLEIGAGYGRLTWRYAALAGQVVAIDPNPDKIARALEEIPEALRGRVTMLQKTLADFTREAKEASFDLALLSWVL